MKSPITFVIHIPATMYHSKPLHCANSIHSITINIDLPAPHSPLPIRLTLSIDTVYILSDGGQVLLEKDFLLDLL